MYEPASGRFASLDPFEGNKLDPQSLHKYGYVHGDPVNHIDPTGEMSVKMQLATLTVTTTIMGLVIYNKHIKSPVHAGATNMLKMADGTSIDARIAMEQKVKKYFERVGNLSNRDSPEYKLFEAAGLDSLADKVISFIDSNKINVMIDNKLESAAEWDTQANIMYLTNESFQESAWEDRTIVHELAHAVVDYKYWFYNSYNARDDEGIAYAVQNYHLSTFEDYLLKAWKFKQNNNPAWRNTLEAYYAQLDDPEKNFRVLVKGNPKGFNMTRQDVDTANREFGIEFDKDAIEQIFNAN